MAIYHLEAKVISRGAGRSACAASAYLSCSQILNDYDGIQHDYTRKSGLVWQQVFLPEFAPQEWSDRAVLWNAVEANEKTKDSRLAREFVVALPIELEKDQWTALLTEYIQTNFVAEGMCADVAIHDTDGHNPHAHIMLTVRPLDEHGKWQYKTEKEYLCVRDGEERGFTATEFKAAQADGWEKQYPYKVGKKKVYMAPSAAETQGLVRVSKHPKSTKYGRQNPIAEKWNSDEQIVVWRKAWADTTNSHLERAGADARIDHRSHAERGLDEQPTIHEGVVARVLEKKGIIADRCEINRQIKADNALLRELKVTVKKLMQAVKNTLSAMAEKLETLRQNMIIFRYQLLYIATGKGNLTNRLNILRPELERYLRLVKQIKDKTKQRNLLLDERKAVPMWNIAKRQDLAKQISTFSEDIEELRSEKAMLLRSLDCADDVAMGDVKKDIAAMESALKKLDEQECKYTAELESALQQYRELQAQATGFDAEELTDARLQLRPGMDRSTVARIQAAYESQYSPFTMAEARRDVSNMLGEYEEEPRSVRERLRNHQQEQTAPRKKEKDRDR
ncbi:MAG: MobA/MobL family protein [Oscillospiraceae bacterium]|nr:MobA/MobL family protein [Oscillospiraceae bacterium]